MSKSKVVTREQAVRTVELAKSEGKAIGFTSGVFDLIHPGHVQYLEDAKLRCNFLVVAVNSDSSVRRIKGDLRPICDERARTAVIAGLASVDLVYLFEEENNRCNIEQIKPEIYFKAGDYSKEKLSSAGVVEGLGGRVEIIPFADGSSTTKTIEKVLSRYSAAIGTEEPLEPPSPAPALFLDRDGTIIKHVEYISEPHKVELFEDTISVLKNFQGLGYRLVVITNQPGIGLGYFRKEDFYRVNQRMMEFLSKGGVLLDKIYYCPHSKSDGCECRKPATSLFRRAQKELNLIKEKSFMLGDMWSDIEAGRQFGLKTILLGKAGPEGAADLVAPSLSEAESWMLQQLRG